MNLTTYSQAFKEDVVRKMLGRGNRTIADMADELNVPYHSVRNWLRKSVAWRMAFRTHAD